MIVAINFLFSRGNNLDKISVPKIRATASALKMPADRRDYKTDFPMQFGEWAFLLEHLYSSFRRCVQEPFPRTDSKGILWRAFAYFCLFAKVSACPA